MRLSPSPEPIYIEDDYVAGQQSWRKKLLDIGVEGFAAHGGGGDHWSADATRSSTRGLPRLLDKYGESRAICSSVSQ
jgi:hypothetical protein